MKPGKFLEKFFLFFLLAFVSAPLSSHSQDAVVSFDHFNNYANGYVPTWVEAGVPIDFKIRVNTLNGSIVSAKGLFELYSPDGATWQPLTADWTAEAALSMNQHFTALYSNDGQIADTIQFSGFDSRFPAMGFQSGSSFIAWVISTQFDISSIGKTVCIDSLTQVVQSTANWLWALENGSGAWADWTGEKCFTIVNDCCQGIHGDVNGDGADANTLDLNWFVNYIFRLGPPPPCLLEADMNGDGNSANNLDMLHLINYKWRNGPPPVSCP